MSMPVSGKVALVTGASAGIGRATAVALAAAGAKVIATGRRKAELEALARQCGGQAVEPIAGDVNDAGFVADLARQAGDVDILVNNAGIAEDNLIIRMKDAQWDAVLDTNLKSVFRLSRAVLRGMMKARAGRIINITSIVGESGNAGQANYSAAKAGIAGFSRSLAREIGSRGITVNCVAPGFIDTDMTRALPEAQRDALLSQIPLGRLGRPARSH